MSGAGSWAVFEWVSLRPVAPIWLIALGLLLGAVALWRSLSKAGGLRTRAGVWVAVLRSVVLLALGWILLGPVQPIANHLSTQQPPEGGRLTVLVDQSRSMQTIDARVLDQSAAERRIGAAQRYLQSGVLDKLGERYRVDPSGFDLGLGQRLAFNQEANPDEGFRANGTETDLRLALQQALVGAEPGDALWVLSDGRTTTGTNAGARSAELELVAAQAQAAGVAIHVLPLGGQNQVPNRAIAAEPERQAYFPDEPVSLEVLVLSSTPESSASTDNAPIRIRATDDLERLVTEQALPAAASNRAESVSLPIPTDWIGHEPGPRHLWIRVDAADGETYLEDNRQAVFFEIAPEPARVLVLEGAPSWQTRFWVDALRTDRRLAVTRVTQLGARKTSDDPKGRRLVTHPEGLPKPVPDPTDYLDTPDGFAAFDLVLLGQRPDTLLEEAERQALLTWVADQGGELAIGSPIDTAYAAMLGPLNPLIEGQPRDQSQTRTITVTENGQAHPVFAPWAAQINVAQLPAIDTAPGQPKPATRVLAAAGDHPVFVSMPIGRGYVTAALTQDLWRWHLAPTPGSEARVATNASSAGASSLLSDWIRHRALGEAAAGDGVHLTVAPWQQRVDQPFELTLNSRTANDALWQAAVQITGPMTALTEAGATDSQPETIALHPVPGSQLRRAGNWAATEAGLYRFDALGQEGGEVTQSVFTVVTNVNREALWTDADPTALWTLAEMSGGHIADPHDWQAFADRLLLDRAAMQPSTQIEPTWEPAWDSGLLMLLIVGLLGSEWLIRRKAGFI